MDGFVKFSESISNELKAKIASIIPREYPCLIVSAKHERYSGFSCTLRLPMDNKDDVLQWKQSFEDKSLTSYSVSETFVENTQKVVFKKRYHCQRNGRHRRRVLKHVKDYTACPAKLTVTIKQRTMKRSKDQHLKICPSEININFVHNHLLMKIAQ